MQLRCSDGKRRITKNGYLPERKIQTGIGNVAVRVPRNRDREAEGEPIRFKSNLVPKYVRKSKGMEALIARIYLKGVSTGDFAEALSATLGKDAVGLSPSTMGRLNSIWTEELKTWRRRNLKSKRYVYLWADGGYCNIRMGDRQGLPVIIGATKEG